MTHNEPREQSQSMETKSNNNFLPASILIAAVLISGSVLYASGKGITKPADGNPTQPQQPRAVEAAPANIDSVKAVSATDHIRGNPDAPVKIVEFSDAECPFCKRFHSTMQQVLQEYDGKVAWIYRHFPLDAIHSKARKEAEATECANELGGNDKFWAYLDRLFEVTPSNNQLDLNQLPEIAAYVGLDKAKFAQCLNSSKYAQRVADDLADGQSSGGNGTPWSIVIAANGKKFPLSGAQPYDSVKQLVELALREK